MVKEAAESSLFEQTRLTARIDFIHGIGQGYNIERLL